MLSLNDVSMGYGEKLLFQHVNVKFMPGRRYGLTGPNGAGKTTMLRIIGGEVDPHSGHIGRPRRTSILKQELNEYLDYPVLEAVIAGNKALYQAMKEKEEILAKGDDISDDDGMKLGEIEVVIAEEDGYTAEPEASTILEGLGIDEGLHTAPVRLLPAGLRLRTLLAQALFGKPDCMLLDEPTNHLDIRSIQWLEGFLREYSGVLVVISHDRHFLNNVCTNIADIDFGTIIEYPGAYDDMVAAKAQYRGQVEKEQKERGKKVAQLQDFVSRFKAGSRSRQARSREKEIRKLQAVEVKRSNIARPYIRFTQERPAGKLAVEMKGITKGFGSRNVFENFHCNIPRGEKVAVIGVNGAGKSTLLKTLIGEYEADQGDVEWGYAAKIGYYPQEHRSAIDTGTTVYEWLVRFCPEDGVEQVRNLLGRMLFKRDEHNKPTDALSGGEAARLLLARLMLDQPNVLVLDEPNNHLDLESITALRDALIEYEGTAIFVTHDQDLIDAVATRIIHIDNGEVEDFPGSFEDFARKTGLGAELMRDPDALKSDPAWG